MLAPIAAPNRALAAALASTKRALSSQRACDRLLDPFGGEREIRLAGEIAGEEFGAVDDDAGLAAAHRGERGLGAGDDEVAAENEVGFACADADRVDVLRARARA